MEGKRKKRNDKSQIKRVEKKAHIQFIHSANVQIEAKDQVHS